MAQNVTSNLSCIHSDDLQQQQATQIHGGCLASIYPGTILVVTHHTKTEDNLEQTPTK